MRLEHSFTVPVPVEEAWTVLLDLPRVVPCMPGATLTDATDDAFTGTVKVKLGPITLTYRGSGRFVERDEAARRVVIEASGKDVRSSGSAAATVTAVLADDAGTTKVDVVTDLSVTGRPAQFGRGMIAEVSGKLLGQFADCLADTLGAGPTPETPAEPATTEPATTGPATTGPATTGPATTEPATTEPATAEPGSRTALSVDAPAVEGPDTAEAHGARDAEPARREEPAAPEAEPVDLLRLGGSTDAARSFARRGAGTVLVAVLAWIVIRWLRRS